ACVKAARRKGRASRSTSGRRAPPLWYNRAAHGAAPAGVGLPPRPRCSAALQRERTTMTHEGTTTPSSPAAVSVADVRFEHLREPFGIGTPEPRLSWEIATEIAGWRQAAYAIEARSPDGSLRGETGRVESDQSVLLPWPFAPLRSRERVLVRVRVWGSDGQESPWSEPRAVEAGLLSPDDWSARFVTPDWDEDAPGPCPLLRREFDVRPGVA